MEDDNNIDRNDPEAVAEEWVRREECLEVDESEFNFHATPAWFKTECNPWSTPAFAGSLDVLRRKRSEAQMDGQRVLAMIEALDDVDEETAPRFICLLGIARGLARQIEHIDALAHAITGERIAKRNESESLTDGVRSDADKTRAEISSTGLPMGPSTPARVERV